MTYFISEKQAIDAEFKRADYKPYIVKKNDCRRWEETMGSGHPLYVSLCDIFVIESASDDVSVYPVVPDGCSAIVFYTHEGVTKGKFCGATDRLKKLDLYPDDSYLVFRFMPGTSKAFLKCDINEMTNASEDVQNCVKNGDRLLKISDRDISMEWKAVLMSRVLHEEEKERGTDYLIRFCTDTILKAEGNVTVSELADRSGFSERYLGKIFERYIGLPPKTYAEIIRLQKSLNCIFNRSEAESLLDVALNCGYFDHAHMNRAYNRFLNCSSGALRREGFDTVNFGKIGSFI